MTVSVPFSERAATPAALRMTSAGHSSRGLPSPTASTLATGSDGTTSRVTCSAPPLAPSAASATSISPVASASRNGLATHRRRGVRIVGVAADHRDDQNRRTRAAFGQRGGDGDGGGLVTRFGAHRITLTTGRLVWLAVTDDLLHGPLEDRHRELGASFAEFGGWLMPVSYAGTVSEHNATRNAVGLFDVSHLGKALVARPGRGRVRQLRADQRPAPDRARQGAVHAVLHRVRRCHRRPDRLLRRRRRDLPGAQRRQHRGGGRGDESRCATGTHDHR